MNKIIFLDTYAIIEIFEGNKNYDKYLDHDIVLTKLNLFELYYTIIRKYGEKTAKREFDRYANFAVDFDNNIIVDAARMRFMFRKQNISMTDCIGYIKARESGLSFLTGDRQFKFLPGVEFVK